MQNTTVFLNGVLVSNQSWTQMWYNFTGLGQGAQNVTVKAYDIIWNEAIKSVEFTIDTIAPTVVISQPLVDAYISNSSVMVVWTASDAGGSGINYTEVRIDANVTWINVGTDSAYTFTDLIDGAHTVDVRTFDMAMNTASASRSFTVDTVAPVVTISDPYEGQLFDVDTVTVYWNGTDLNGIDHYEVSYNGEPFENVGLDISKEFSMLNDGMHNVVVEAFDLAMNTNSSFVNFVTDATDPEIAISFPALGYMTNLNNVTVYWNATDATSGVNHTTYAIDGGAAVKIEGVGPYSMWFAALSEGSHTVEVMAYDVAGHHKGASVSFLVDLTAPTIAITVPVQDHYYNVALIHGAWTVVDTQSGVAEILVKLDGAVDWTSIGWNATHDFAGLTHGDHTIQVKAIDNVTNERVVSVTFHVDLVAPTITAKSPSGVAVAIGTTVSVTFSEAMLTSSVSIAGVPAVIMGTPVWSVGNTVATWTQPVGGALAYATNYTLTVSGTDLAGNAISGDRTVVFKTITQVTGTVKDANGNAIQGANVSLSMPGMTTVYTLTDANGHFAIPIAGGTYSLKVSKSGFDDLSKQITVGPGLVNNLGNLGMNPTADYTLPIVIVVIVLGAALVFLFLRRRKA
jgi:hypothetical protein